MSWYVKTVEDGINEYKTAKEAEEAARGELQHHEDNASDGWHENVTELEWGEMICHAYVVKTSEEPAPEGSEFDTIASYDFNAQRIEAPALDPWTAELVRLANEYREARVAYEQGRVPHASALGNAQIDLLIHAYNGGKAP